MNATKHGNLLFISIIIILNFLTYFNGINNEFVWDDNYLIKNNEKGNYKKATEVTEKIITGSPKKADKDKAKKYLTVIGKAMKEKTP